MTDNLRTSTAIRPGTYLIDTARSRAAFSTTHVFGLKPVDGTVPIRSGTVVVAAEVRRSTASADLDPAGFATDNPKRDQDIRGKRFLDVARYPAIAFRSTRVHESAEGWQIVGELAVKGGSAEVTLLVTDMAPTVDGYRFTATTTVALKAIGLSAPVFGRTARIRLDIHVTAG